MLESTGQWAARFRASGIHLGIILTLAALAALLVFEFDRFRVVHAIDIPQELLDKAPPPMRQLPLTGPTLLSVRDFKDSKESFDATMAALQGATLGARPDLWQPYESAKNQVLTRARPLAELKSRFPGRAGEIEDALRAAKSPPDRPISYLPMVERDRYWSVLIDSKTAEVIAFVPVDSF